MNWENITKHGWIKENSNLLSLKSGTRIKVHNTNSIEGMLYDYSRMYMKSASKITKYMLDSNDIYVLDLFLFPMTFLIRHSLELCLKACIFTYVKDDKKRVFIMKNTKHNLVSLFDELQSHTSETIDFNSTSMKWLKSFLYNINSIDKESDSFRYPFFIKVKGATHYMIDSKFKEQTDIDLIKFIKKMFYAHEILNSIFLNSFDKLCSLENFNTTLFEAGGTYYNKAVIGYKFSLTKFTPFIIGYKEVAKLLFDFIKSTDDEDFNDCASELFLPMCYLLRNSVELSLKMIIFEDSSHNYLESLKKINNKKHKIVGLWNFIEKEIVEITNYSEYDPSCDIAFDYIRQINELDPSADIFRYPIDNKLNVYFKSPKEFDINNVYSFFMDLLNFLLGTSSMISDLKDYIDMY